MLEYLVQTYGYPVLFIGTFLEGETILILAGIAAFEGLLDVNQAVLVAFLGSMSGDTVYFVLGRRKGQWLLEKVPRWRARIDRVLRLLERHSIWLILTFRFMYAVRNVASVAVGMSRTPVWLFLSLNAVGAAVWALSFGYGGYLFGEALIVLVKDLKDHQIQVLEAVGLLACAFWLFRHWRRHRSRRGPHAPSAPESPLP